MTGSEGGIIDLDSRRQMPGLRAEGLRAAMVKLGVDSQTRTRALRPFTEPDDDGDAA